ncbi:MAG: hypothetical protein PWP03_472 [Candidatus Woesearchaeota archaeon]|nr:hypothetical protein [Candidatus Woesearchaeota archaeon]MDN5327834.1 hypothetical protein [Candidatus Woesearchaeota archaeon]
MTAEKEKEISAKEYYNIIARRYLELYGQEQLEKALFLKQISDFKESDKILDVGSGTGHYLKVLKGNFVCVDPSEQLLSFNPYEKYVAKAEHLPFPDKSFDYTISLTAIQNFDDVDKAIDEMIRVTKKMIYISTLQASKVNKILKKVFKKKNITYSYKKFNKEIFYIINLKNEIKK